MTQVSSSRPFSSFLAPVRLALLSLALLVLAGCSSTLSRVQTWDGAGVDASQVAVLRTPGEIQVVEVNGREVGNFLMDDLALDYELLPGSNKVVFKYKTIWAKATGRDNDESNVNTVESGLQQVVIEARAGDVYNFVLPEPQNRREAEVMIRNFRTQVVNESGAVVANSQRYQATAPVAQVAPVTAGAVAGAAAVPVAPGGDLNALDALKVLWERASAEDKREFLRWAFD